MRADAWHLPLSPKAIIPDSWRIANVHVNQLSLVPELDLAMVGAGGLMGLKSAANMLLGMFINFAIIVPWMISIGELKPQSGDVTAGTATFGRAYILNNWALWWGICLMVSAAMVSLFAKPHIFVQALRSILARGRRQANGSDVLSHIELPLAVSWIGIPIFGTLGVWMANSWFGVDWVYGATAILLIMLLTVVAASSTAMTGLTPTGSLSKIPQFLYGALDPKHPPTNLMTGVMCVEVASNASNLLMDIKPGYMLGAKPRQQAIGHCIGILAGAIAATPLFFALFLPNYKPGDDLQAAMVNVEKGIVFPAADQWVGVSKLVTAVFDSSSTTRLLSDSIFWSMVIATAAGLICEVVRIVTRNRFPISPLPIGLGVLVTPASTMSMCLGAALFWLMHRLYVRSRESTGRRLWVDSQEPICAGLIAGAALIGIADTLIENFLLKKQ
jgi:uncharacterized oligopeptide transporter (OPT) family protein